MTIRGQDSVSFNMGYDDGACILLIATDADEAARVLVELTSATEERFRVEWITDLHGGIERLVSGGIGAVVLDLNMPDSEIGETFNLLFRAAPNIPILILSEAKTEEMARLGVQLGAQDYLLKEQADGYRLRRTVRGIMNRRTAEAAARDNEIVRGTLNSLGEAVLRTNLKGELIYLNRFAEGITGWSREEALGHPIADVLRLINSESRKPMDNPAAAVLQKDGSAKHTVCNTDCILVRRDGVEFGIENIVTSVDDRAGEIVGAVVVIRDVGLARAAAQQIALLAQHDILTGLPNRTLFNDRLIQALSLAKREKNQLAVLYVDLDQFKRINDSLGHAVGDVLLRSVAGRLSACVRRTDTVCRIGGDEFVVLLSQVKHSEDAAITARKILRAIAVPHLIDNKSLDINVSIGGSIYPADGEDLETLMNSADSAMYESKQNGRNGYQFFRSDMHVRAAKRLSLEGDLRYALGRNEFVLHYQPTIDLQTGQITGVEALIRWEHPKHGILLPTAFVPIAEECGLIVHIGQWVLLEACRQCRAWQDRGFGIVPISVNVSSAEFRAKDFLSGVRAVLIATGVEPENLELELTESVLMQDAESAVVTLLALKAMGVHLAIDDFGTGYSSFTYLRRFPANTLKIDQSFVQQITTESEGISLVSAMIGIGKSLEQRVIAEGVETRFQCDFLRRHGCVEGQGFYFSQPVTGGHAETLFTSGIQQRSTH